MKVDLLNGTFTDKDFKSLITLMKNSFRDYENLEYLKELEGKNPKDVVKVNFEDLDNLSIEDGSAKVVISLHIS